MVESLSSAHWLAANAALIIFMAVVHLSVMAMLLLAAWNAVHYRGEVTEEPVQPMAQVRPMRPAMTHPVFAAAEPTEDELARRPEPPSDLK